MPKAIIINSTNIEKIKSFLERFGVKQGAHFTNGTYAYRSADDIWDTTVIGFEHVISEEENQNSPLVVAINSDKSMRRLGKDNFEPQVQRARKISSRLAEHFSSRQVIIIFYDDSTPNNLYRILNESGFKNSTLHKWGYGYGENVPKIEGSEFFPIAYSFPFSDKKSRPVCFNETAVGLKIPNNVRIVDLSEKLLARDSFYNKATFWIRRHRYTIFGASVLAIAATTVVYAYSKNSGSCSTSNSTLKPKTAL